MPQIWDYNIKALKKSKNGRLKILERMINFGPIGREKISLSKVKKNWDKLHIYSPQRKLLELLIWGKYKSSRLSRKLSWPE